MEDDIEARALVSVVIPVHNRVHLVEYAIRSALDQTYPDVEVVAVDDGSTDGTDGVLQAIAAAEHRVTVVTHARSRGAQAARNAGIRASSGAWVAFLDSDDRYHSDSVALRMAAAQVSGAGVVHSDGRRITAGGVEPSCNVPPLSGRPYQELLAGPGPLFPSLLVRRDVLERIGYLDETIVAWQEWDTSIRLARIAEFGFVPAATFDYDVRTLVAISRDPARSARGYEQIVRKHWREIVRELGFRGLAKHCQTMTGLRREAGDRSGALRCRALSVLLWPPNVMRPVRRLIGRSA